MRKLILLGGCVVALGASACDGGGEATDPVTPGAAVNADGLPSWVADKEGLAPDEEIAVAEDTTIPLPDPIGVVVSLQAEEGIDLDDGVLVAPAAFDNADLIATHNGDGLRLSSGGTTPVDLRPVNWFITPSGAPAAFSSLDAIPDDLPSSDMTAALPIAEIRCGFIVQTQEGDWVKGWIRDVDWDAWDEGWRIDIEFVAL